MERVLSLVILLVVRYILSSILLFGGSFVFLIGSLLRPFHISIGYWFGRTISEYSLWVLGVKKVVEWPRKDYSKESIVYVGNHQHTLDLYVFSSSIFSNTVAVGKTTIVWIPLFGWLFWLAGQGLLHRKNNNKAINSLKNIAKRMCEETMSVLIFPEGTRSWGRGMGPFKKGAFRLAADLNCKIIPIVASSYHKNVNLRRWNSGTVLLKYLEPIETAGRTVEELMDLTRAVMKTELDKLDVQVAELQKQT